MRYLRKHRKLILFALIVQIAFFSCKKKKEDIYYSLTADQISFITAVNAGDTVIWQSTSGYKDTAIILPLVHEQYVINPNYSNDAKKIGERESYDYQIIGTKKSPYFSGPYFGMAVYADDTYSPWLKNACITINPDGFFSTKKIGGITYSNVYWSNSFVNPDTLFWNSSGYLGYISSTETYYKIK